jgi:hypothetical protein
MNNNNYNNLAEATEKLKDKGFSANFRVNDNKLLEDGEKHTFKPSEVELVEFHRFEGMTNPADSSILYAVKTSSGLKGIVVDSYGADGSEITSEFMNQTSKS